MQPAAYPAAYLTLPVYFDDWSSTLVSIRNYLQSGKGEQSPRAQAAKGVLVRKIASELHVKGNLPKTFDLEGYPVQSSSINRAFMGKGAPDEIQDVLWLASRYGIVNASSVQTYCDRNLGTDCGGFVACLWGIGKPVNGNEVEGSTGFLPRSFWNFDKTKRRARASDIQVGDAIIFFKHVKDDNTDLANVDPAKGGEAFHIGAVGGIRINPNNTLDLALMESSGAATVSGGTGVTQRLVYALPLKTARGLTYAVASDCRLYFVGKAVNLTPYLPYGWQGDD